MTIWEINVGEESACILTIFSLETSDSDSLEQMSELKFQFTNTQLQTILLIHDLILLITRKYIYSKGTPN